MSCLFSFHIESEVWEIKFFFKEIKTIHGGCSFLLFTASQTAHLMELSKVQLFIRQLAGFFSLGFDLMEMVISQDFVDGTIKKYKDFSTKSAD